MKPKTNLIAVVAAFALALPLSAKDAMSVNEFSALEIREARSVKIVDVLGKENQGALADACRKSDALIDLDLSGCTFPADEEAKIDLFHIRNVRSCVLPKTTKRIVNFDCDELESVALPEGLLRIGAKAFFESGLKSVVIPDSVEYVGACAFGDSPSLRLIKIGKNADTGKWSPAWSAWNDALVTTEEKAELPTEREPFPDRIEFDHANYHLMGGKMNIKITFAEPRAKSENALLYFCDAHDGGIELCAVEVKLKKKKREIALKDFPAIEIGIADTPLPDAVLEECGDYWVKLSCFLELSDGTRIPLEGSARLYFAGK